MTESCIINIISDCEFTFIKGKYGFNNIKRLRAMCDATVLEY